MDLSTVAAILTGIAGVVGGYVGGKKNNTLAESTVHLLQTQVDELRIQCGQIPALLERIAMLEELVTQRAKVEEVLAIVTEIQEKLNNA